MKKPIVAALVALGGVFLLTRKSQAEPLPEIGGFVASKASSYGGDPYQTAQVTFDRLADQNIQDFLGNIADYGNQAITETLKLESPVKVFDVSFSRNEANEFSRPNIDIDPGAFEVGLANSSKVGAYATLAATHIAETVVDTFKDIVTGIPVVGKTLSKPLNIAKVNITTVREKVTERIDDISRLEAAQKQADDAYSKIGGFGSPDAYGGLDPGKSQDTGSGPGTKGGRGGEHESTSDPSGGRGGL